MNAAVLAGAQFGEVLELVHLLGEIFVNLLLGLIELLIILLLAALEEGLLLVSHLLSRTVHHSSQVLDELLVIAEVIFGDLEGFLVDLH